MGLAFLHGTVTVRVGRVYARRWLACSRLGASRACCSVCYFVWVHFVAKIFTAAHGSPFRRVCCSFLRSHVWLSYFGAHLRRGDVGLERVAGHRHELPRQQGDAHLADLVLALVHAVEALVGGALVCAHRVEQPVLGAPRSVVCKPNRIIPKSCKQTCRSLLALQFLLLHLSLERAGLRV